jgi:hypothetical protein
MFRVIKYRNVSGKIQATIETDDQTMADFLRFFGSVNKFVDLFHYRMRSAKSFDLYQKTAPHKMALHKKNIAEQLERFRVMPGTRIERMRILKEIRVSNGERVTLDQIDVEIRHAMRYEKEDKLLLIKKYINDGKSLNDISKIMNLPKSTVRRLIIQLRPPETPTEKPSIAPESVSPPKGA